MAVQVVVFTLGLEEYAMPIEVVREITRLGEVRAIPKAPPYVRGLINIRGIAIPLIDLHVRFGIERTQTTTITDGKTPKENAFALITEVHGNNVGFEVDQVREVRILENIDPPPPLVTASFIAGIANLSERMIIQLIPEQILESNEIQRLSQITAR
ncbi:chemotaxis protein CheW [Desulfosporosinus sp. OT]|uniref:chemotaxis protein CheW n=1 Tax=Desulfosporosinus sp. OT TaxID=913865 RepID=UPI000223B13F|nr:chemotaxis protein CheW [Desulfosporosinus sp. OT]EGW36753.1 chemotaxis signal transduction protein [Desulfosporosinus sp. OT]